MKASRKARSVIDVMLGEATYGTPAERWADMVAIASVIENRARQLGVTPEQVVASTQEFNAYNKALPAGVGRYRSMAQQALDYVKQNGPVHNATFYAAPNSVGNLPRGLSPVTQTTGHAFFSDPFGRAIKTAAGYKTPGRAVNLPSSPPTPTARPSAVADINPARWGGPAPAPDPGVLGRMASKPAPGLFGATTGIDPNRPFDFANMDMGRMLSKNVAISPEVARAAAGPRTSPHNWDVGPTSPFDFSKIDMGRMLSRELTRTPFSAQPSTPAEQVARSAAAAAANPPGDDVIGSILAGADAHAFAAMQGNELQLGRPAAPETQIAAALPPDRPMSIPSVSPAAQQDLSGIAKAMETTRQLASTFAPPGGTIYSMADAVNAPAVDETLAAYAPPDVPAAPSSTFEKVRTMARPAVRNALLGMKFAGLPGAAVGALAGLVPDSWRPDFGPTFDAAVPASERFSTGYGLSGITAAMGGPRGAQGFSRSNPGMSYTSLGDGSGIRRSEKYGWSEVVGPDGSVRGISYDNPTGGGILGDISRAMNERFGGKSKAERKTDTDKSKFSGRSGGGRAGTGSHGRGGGRLT